MPLRHPSGDVKRTFGNAGVELKAEILAKVTHTGSYGWYPRGGCSKMARDPVLRKANS